MVNILMEDIDNIDSIIKYEQIRTLFQPIVSLKDAEVLGYEALSRGPKGSILELPQALFDTAAKRNMLWELEYLCRIKAIERAREMAKTKKIFINVDPKVILDEKYKIGFTKEFLSMHSIDPAKIIFEITEKTCIEDYRGFLKVINNYTNQGYKIAIDDIGAGYSGLRTLAEVHPQYIKIDMALVRDIDKKTINQALIKALRDFSYSTNMHLIAEGIETIDELNTLIDLDIEYGQGYIFQKPAEKLMELEKSIQGLVRQRYERKYRKQFQTTNTVPVGEIARLDMSIDPAAKGSVVDKMFNDTPSLYGIPVVENDIPVGIVMRNYFYTQLATQYGNAVFMNRPISLLMNKDPLVVDYNTSLAQVSKVAIGRRDEELYDYIIISRDNKYYGVTTVKNLLEQTTQMELSKAKSSNPLTGLPGNSEIESKLKAAIIYKEKCHVIYYDLDNFKAYNDIYGFEKGDEIIKCTSELIQECANRFEWDSIFIGHLGGDDFVSVIYGDKVEEYCKMLVKEFDKEVVTHYSFQDRQNQYIISRNRYGIEEKYPIMSISVAVLNCVNHNFRDTDELTELLSNIKKKCKLSWQSCYIIE